MSLTTSNDNDRSPIARARSLIARLRPAAQEDADTPTEILEFYSPSAAVMLTPVATVARKAVTIIGLLFFSLCVIFATMPIDRIVSGTGKVISLTPELVVQPVNAAIVKAIAVSSGDIVRKGQLLAQLDPTVAASNSEAAQGALDRYQTEVDRLTAELHQEPYKPKTLTPGAVVQQSIFAQRAAAREAQLRYYQGQIDAQKATLSQAEADIRQYAKQTGIAVDVERIRRQLNAEQVGSNLDLLQATSARVEAERQVLAAVQQREAAKQQLAALEGQLQNYNQQWFADVSQNLTDDSVQVANYKNQLELAALSLKLIDLRADQDAIVLSVAPVSVGSIVQAGQTMFTLVPLNAAMEIQVQITGDQSGLVVVGMPANIKFQTFPFAYFGVGYGTVRQLSADSFLTGATSNGGSSAGTTSDMIFTGLAPLSPYFYDVRVTVDRLDLHHVPTDFHLVPGMPVTVDIKVGNQTIWDYISVRIEPTFTEGMREPT